MSLLNLPEFQASLLRFAHEDVPQNLMRRQIEISLYLLNKLQTRTPIDTGFAVSNWRMNVDRIPSGTLGTYERAKVRRMHYNPKDPYRFRKPVEAPLQGRSRDTLIQTAFERGQEYNAMEWKKVGHVIYVFNNVKYMKYLEQGHSKQAPNGITPLAIAETKAWMKSKGW